MKRLFLGRATALLATLVLSIGTLLAANAAPAQAVGNGWIDPVPLNNPAAGWLASGCGTSRQYEPGLYHIGRGYWAAAGTDVHAIGDGTVHLVTGFGAGFGQAMFVKHKAADGAEFLVLYGHVTAGKAAGETVNAGDHIADITGGDHLHLGLFPSATGLPSSGWGRMRCGPDGVSGTNGFVDPIPFLNAHSRQSASTGPVTRLMGDVNGDGKSDAVVMFRDTGTAMVVLSTGSSFATPSSWAYLHTVGADKYFLADVNGDRMADLVAFWQPTGKWYVSLSSGSGFWPETDWATGHGVGTTKQWVTNVNNDGMADLVTYDAATGDWHVSTSSGSGFWAPVRWIGGHGVGSASQEVADFTGDGKADSGVWFTNGNWYVATSNGSSFSGYTQWSAGQGLNSGRRLVGDVSGDNRADTAYFFASNGHWDIGTSSGSGFWAPTAWAHGHGTGTTEQFLAKVNGDNMADVVTFDRATGDWYVSTSSGTGFWAPARWMSGHGANS